MISKQLDAALRAVVLGAECVYKDEAFRRWAFVWHNSSPNSRLAWRAARRARLDLQRGNRVALAGVWAARAAAMRLPWAIRRAQDVLREFDAP